MGPDDVQALRSAVRTEVGRAVVGQGAAIDLMLVALLARGHVLLEGLPGTAKTLLVRSFARALDLEFRRIQFTPDLMPGDVVGTNVYHFETHQFVLTKGPVFTQLLLADEINRTPPKTQAALLEAMQERRVTIDGIGHDLGPGFMVLATQNPIEQEGTYPLPEAQLDRFLVRVPIHYPPREDEIQIVMRHGRGGTPDLASLGIEAVADLARVETLRAVVADVRLAPEIVEYVVDLVRATREHPALSCGASPRAAAMVASAARALAALSGRDYVVPDDAKMLLAPCLGHRVVVSATAEIEGQDAKGILADVVGRVAAPR